MDDQQLRRLRGKRKLAVFVVGLAVIGILAFAYQYSEGRKDEAANTVAVVVSEPLTPEQARVLEDNFNRYAPEDNRARVTLNVYVMSDAGPEGQVQALADSLNEGVPNLYLMDEDARERLHGLLPLQVLSKHYPGDPAVTDAVYYCLSGKSFFQALDDLEMPVCYLALQDANSYAVTKDARTQSFYAYQSRLLDQIARDAPVQ